MCVLIYLYYSLFLYAWFINKIYHITMSKRIHQTTSSFFNTQLQKYQYITLNYTIIKQESKKKENQECINGNSSSLLSRMSKGIYSKSKIGTFMEKPINLVQDIQKNIIGHYEIDQNQLAITHSRNEPKVLLQTLHFFLLANSLLCVRLVLYSNSLVAHYYLCSLSFLSHLRDFGLGIYLTPL